MRTNKKQQSTTFDWCHVQELNPDCCAGERLSALTIVTAHFPTQKGIIFDTEKKKKTVNMKL